MQRGDLMAKFLSILIKELKIICAFPSIFLQKSKTIIIAPQICQSIQINLKDMLETTSKDLPPHPQVIKSLKQYEALRQQYLRHIFDGEPLNISNKDIAQVYTGAFNTFNTMNIAGNKNFQCPDKTYYQAYLRDMTNFGKKASERISMAMKLPADQLIRCVGSWLNNYARFNHWIFRTFMIIERNKTGYNLYSDGLKILQQFLIDSIYNQIYAAILECMKLYKQGSLEDYEPLQVVIKYIGIIGFTMYKKVDMIKIGDRFEFSSLGKLGSEPEDPYESVKFKELIFARLSSDLQANYEKIAIQLTQLQVNSYFQKVQKLIGIEEKTADIFYKPVKEPILRIVVKTLVLDHVKKLIFGQNGVKKMVNQRDISSIAKILILLKKAKEEQIFYKQFCQSSNKK